MVRGFNRKAVIGLVNMVDLVRPKKRARVEEPARPVSESWAVSRFALGFLDDDGNFSIEYSHPFEDGGQLETDPERRRVVISGDGVEMRISVLSIEHVGIGDRSKTKVLFTLTHAPFFGRRGPDGKLNRLSSLDAEHASLIQTANRHVLVVFSDGARRERFCEAGRHQGFPQPAPAAITLTQEQPWSAEQMHELDSSLQKLSCPVAFQVHALVLAGLLAPDTIVTAMKGFQDLEQQLGVRRAEQVCESLLDRLQSARADARRHSPQPQPHKPPHRHLSDARKHVASLPAEELPNSMCLIRSAVVTPTGVDLEGPVVEQSNATFRLYPNHTDCFLRVSLRDEDHSAFPSMADWNVSKFLAARYKPILVDGLRVAGRTFRFVGYSASGLKTQTAIFVADFTVDGELVTAEVIRQRMGDFVKCERIPAKWMARVGQMFSTSSYALTLAPEEVRLMPDIAPPDSPWIFTDGVGTISRALAREVEAALAADASPRELRGRVPSTCFQVRIGGAKGMLSIDTGLKGRRVHLRPSMIKFDAAWPITLNVASAFGRPSLAVANRPLIQILEGLGVPADEFCKLQEAAMDQTQEAKRTWAGLAGLLGTIDLGRAALLPATVEWLGRVLGGAGAAVAVTDPFIRQCAELAVLQSHRQLKFKARIPMPGCWTLVGIVDETPGGFLGENEIYACVHEPGKEPVYLEGEVVISRSPVVHPGDVRIVRAVGKVDSSRAPKVACQKNCVVFPVKGPRPLPSMLGGGDCDGDVYQIITTPSLFPKRIDPPGPYDAPESKSLPRPSTVADAVDFFLGFGMRDCVSQVATSHLYWGDCSTDGIYSVSCKLLAKAHSTAIDYAKTGVAVTILDLPKPPTPRPDFAISEGAFLNEGEGTRKTYRSTKVLGLLYRMIGPDLVRARADAPWSGTGSSSQGAPLDPKGRIASALEARFGLPAEVDTALLEDVKSIMRRFVDDLRKIARLCSLSSTPLSEHELLLGTIADPGRRGAYKKERAEGLSTATGALFGAVRREVAGEGGAEERVARCWAAWRAARGAEGEWGARVFGWVVLGELREALEDEERGLEVVETVDEVSGLPLLILD